jgi:hypothetical protein
MMGDTVATRLDNQEVEAIEDMIESGMADNQAEALRQVAHTGFVELGYINGEKKEETTLQKLARESARALIYVGVGWLLLGWMFPVSFRAPAAAVVVAGAGLLAFERVLEEYEPGVSRRLFGWYGGGERA